MEKIKLSKLVESSQALQAFFSANLVEVPVKTRYWLSKLSNKVKTELNTYDEERIKFLEEFGERYEDEKTHQNMYKFNDKAKIDGFNEKIKELGSQEIELEFTKVKLEDLQKSEDKLKELGDKDKMLSKVLTIETLGLLDWLIEE